MSTPGGVQYIGGYHEYIGGCSGHQRDTKVYQGDIMSTPVGYHDYIKGCSVHRGIS